MSETDVQKKIRLGVAKFATLFRNNVGTGWVGKVQNIVRAGTVRVSAGDVVIRSARPLHAGLFKGSSDLIGWTTVEVGPEHVGRRFAVFTAVEVKADKGQSSHEQDNFIAQVEKAGGFAGIARDIGDALNIVGVAA